MTQKKILVPVDYSPSSKLALEWAVVLAQSMDAMGRLAVIAGERRRDEVVDYWKREAGGLSGSGLGKANQIPAGESQRDSLLLYRCGMGVTCVTYRVQHFRREVELRKG